MERKVPFFIGETYHAYTRGVDKRVICENNCDYERLQLLLYLCNSTKTVAMRTVLNHYRGEPLESIFLHEKRGETLVDILAYALMPNHFHLLLREKKESGISRFMLKLLTGYSMYFNTKRERSGPLFTRPFRSKHVDSDEYLRWVQAYILLNPLELHQYDWKKTGIRDIAAAKAFMQRYPYSSFQDGISSRAAKNILIEEIGNEPSFHTSDDLLSGLSDILRNSDHADAEGSPW